MSILAIDAIHEYLNRNEQGIPVSEIKRKIADFVKERDIFHALHPRGHYDKNFYKTMVQNRTTCVREGKEIERIKLAPTT